MSYNYLTFGLLESDVVGLTAEQRTAIEFQLTVSIVSEGTWLYRNFKFPRYKNNYGYAQIMSGAYVVQSVSLDYLNQQILFFEADTFDISDNIACAARAILGALTPPSNAVISVTKHRTHITSVRFRFYSGIKANVGIRWVTPESNCGNAVLEPDKEQNEPIAPNNANSDPGSRPASQGGDSADKSPNDGNSSPGDNLPPPPKPGEGTNFPCWHYYGQGKRNPPACTPYNFVGRYDAATNPNIRPIYTKVRDNQFCSGAEDGKVMYGNAEIDQPGGITSIDFYYG